jgi:hypothetical protein
MSSKSSSVTREEARELKRRDAEISRTGGVPHEEIVRRSRERMDRELRRIVSGYKHPGDDLTNILERMAIADAEGVDVTDPCRELLHKIAAASRPRAA